MLKYIINYEFKIALITAHNVLEVLITVQFVLIIELICLNAFALNNFLISDKVYVIQFVQLDSILAYKVPACHVIILVTIALFLMEHV